jgi:hypothetical protein
MFVCMYVYERINIIHQKVEINAPKCRLRGALPTHLHDMIGFPKRKAHLPFKIVSLCDFDDNSEVNVTLGRDEKWI